MTLFINRQTVNRQTVIRQIAILPLLLLISLLTACGFQLRGQLDIASEVSQLAISGGDLSYVRQLSQALQNNGIEISDNAPYRLQVLDVTQDSDNQARATAGYNEHLLSLKITYRLETADGLQLFEPFKLSSERYITLDQNQVNAGFSEEDINFKELKQDLINTTVRRIGGISGDKLREEEARVRKIRQMKQEKTAETEAQ